MGPSLEGFGGEFEVGKIAFELEDLEKGKKERGKDTPEREKSEGRRGKQGRTSLVLGFLRGYSSACVFLR